MVVENEGGQLQRLAVDGGEFWLDLPHRILGPGQAWCQMAEHVVDHQHHVLLGLDERQSDHWVGVGEHLDLLGSAPRLPSQGPYHLDRDAHHDVRDVTYLLDLLLVHHDARDAAYLLDLLHVHHDVRDAAYPLDLLHVHHDARDAAYLLDLLHVHHDVRDAAYPPDLLRNHHVFRAVYVPVNGHHRNIFRAFSVPVSSRRHCICGIRGH